jgi:hypothetical protein
MGCSTETIPAIAEVCLSNCLTLSDPGVRPFSHFLAHAPLGLGDGLVDRRAGDL